MCLQRSLIQLKLSERHECAGHGTSEHWQAAGDLSALSTEEVRITRFLLFT